MNIKNKNIILGVCGSIAAYKSVYLLRLLIKNQANVSCILTESAKRFVSPLTFAALSNLKTYTDFFSDQLWEETHLKLSKNCELIIVAPATANFIAKISNGFADDLLTATVLASNCKKVIVPAMHKNMWENKITQRNVSYLKEVGICFIGPEKGKLASGEEGVGRMSEPETILNAIKKM